MPDLGLYHYGGETELENSKKISNNIKSSRICPIKAYVTENYIKINWYILLSLSFSFLGAFFVSLLFVLPGLLFTQKEDQISLFF